jgi:hypothetical protein
MTMPNFKWFDSISKRILIWIQIVNSFSEVVKWIMGITVMSIPAMVYMTSSVSVTTILVISIFFVFLLLAVIFLNKEYRSLCKLAKDLEVKNKALMEQYHELEKRSCIFTKNCTEFGVLNPYIGKDNGFFPNVYDINNCVEICKSCSEEHFVPESLAKAKSFRKLESEVNVLLKKVNEQNTRVFIEFHQGNKEFAQKLHDYLEQNQICCAQVTNCNEISKFVDKKTFVIILHWDDPANPYQSPENTKPWLTARLRAYHQSMEKITRQSGNRGRKQTLEVWLCSNLVNELSENNQIPKKIVAKHITECLPELCCDDLKKLRK